VNGIVYELNPEQEIKQFRSFFTKRLTSRYHVIKLCEDAFSISPKKNALHIPGKNFGLTLTGIIHGNELGGLKLLNTVLECFVESSSHEIPFPLAFVLGNPEAAKKQCRFIDTDLNRAFGQVSGLQSLESCRAKELEPIFAESAFMIDFHQTIEPTLTPFWISPFRQETWRFASRLLQNFIPFVTNKPKENSKNGYCADDFVSRKGGVALTIELGEKGFNPYQNALGYQVTHRALSQLIDYFSGKAFSDVYSSPSSYTWVDCVPYPKGEVLLQPGLRNFQDIEEQQLLGTSSGKPILASCSGKILFPKYVNQNQPVKPKELFRIIRPTTLASICG